MNTYNIFNTICKDLHCEALVKVEDNNILFNYQFLNVVSMYCLQFIFTILENKCVQPFIEETTIIYFCKN